MGVEKAVFYSTSDRPDQEGIVQKYTISGQNMNYIVKKEMTWREFYAYVQSVATIEELKEIPK